MLSTKQLFELKAKTLKKQVSLVKQNKTVVELCIELSLSIKQFPLLVALLLFVSFALLFGLSVLFGFLLLVSFVLLF